MRMMDAAGRDGKWRAAGSTQGCIPRLHAHSLLPCTTAQHHATASQSEQTSLAMAHKQRGNTAFAQRAFADAVAHYTASLAEDG
jgi:hypothetical protein